MRKTISIIALIVVLIAMVSCASAGGAANQAEAEPQAIHVTTMEELAEAVKADNAIVIVDNDIAWNPMYVNGAQLEIRTGENAVIDFNGHQITELKHAALRIFGDFTIKNGTFIGEGNSYGLLINSNNTTSGVDYNPETRENHKVTVENMKLVECGIRAELSTIEIINCDIQNSGDSGNGNTVYFVGVFGTVSGGKLSQTGEVQETISRTNCVYASGNSTVSIIGVALEGTKRVNAYKNVVSYTVKDCPDAVTSTPDYVKFL